MPSTQTNCSEGLNGTSINKEVSILTNQQNTQSASDGCCSGSDFNCPPEMSEQMPRMMKQFFGGDNAFDCSAIMEQFRGEDGSINCSKMMETMQENCFQTSEEKEAS